MAVTVEPEAFEALVVEAIDSLPAELRRAMDNVAVVIGDRAPGDDLYGLYEGVPLTQRSGGYVLAVPDRITIYAGTICGHARTREEVAERVRITVLHEIAHHFGIGGPPPAGARLGLTVQRRRRPRPPPAAAMRSARRASSRWSSIGSRVCPVAHSSSRSARAGLRASTGPWA